MSDGIAFVRIRFYELADILNKWGYTVVPDPDEDEWAVAVRAAPLTGRIQLRGDRVDGLSFTITEVWEEGDKGDDAASVREGASLTTYHYHGSSEHGGMRWCLHPAGHPDIPYHLHPFGNPAGDPAHADRIDPEGALGSFESEYYVSRFGLQKDDE